MSFKIRSFGFLPCLAHHSSYVITGFVSLSRRSLSSLSSCSYRPINSFRWPTNSPSAVINCNGSTFLPKIWSYLPSSIQRTNNIYSAMLRYPYPLIVRRASLRNWCSVNFPEFPAYSFISVHAIQSHISDTSCPYAVFMATNVGALPMMHRRTSAVYLSTFSMLHVERNCFAFPYRRVKELVCNLCVGCKPFFSFSFIVCHI